MSNDSPVVLTWDPNEEASNSEIQGVNPVISIPAEPPSYTAARRPTTNVKYTFSPVGSNSMMLLPPATSPDTRPQYFITSAVNVFMPFSAITTVYRGANEFGERVGEFEMGLIFLPARLVRNGEETRLDFVCKKERGSKAAGIWSWKYASDSPRRIQWDYTSSVAKCILYDNRLLATYKHGPIGYQLPIVRSVYSQLTVTPEGQSYFDQIVLSLLVVERKRLTAPVEMKQLWN